MSHDCFATLAALLPEAMLLVGADGVVGAANPAAVRLFGRPASELCGASLAHLVLDESSVVADLLRAGARTRSLVPAAVTIDVPGANPVACRCEAGVLQPRTSTSVPLVLLRLSPEQAAVNEFVLLNQRIDKLTVEVARRRAAEANLQAYAGRLRVTLSSIGDAVIATDHEGRVTLMNAVASALTGWPENEAMGRHLDDVFSIVTEHSRQTVESPVAKVLREGNIVGLANHTLLIARDGSERQIDDSGAPIHGDDGKLLGVVLVFRDITQRYAMERELAERAEKLVEADRQKDRFLAMLAHELRNPLAPLKNGVHLLLREPSPAAAVRTAQMMQRQVNHLARLVDDLLDVARLTSGRIELRTAPVDLVHVMHEAVEMSRSLFDQQSHRLTMSPRQPSLMVQADATRLVQVFVNLLSNAANYTPQEGAIAFVCDVDEGDAVVSVRDSGVGIDPALQASIFDLFVQGNRSLDRREGGLGIGLTVARALVRMHGGSIAVHSEGTGGGSTFVVRLPLLQSQTPETTAPEPVPESRRGGLRILVVDDNTDAAESLALILDQWAYQSEVATDGRQAVARWHTFQPDVVLLDIGLPGMSGYELARHLRLLPRGSDVLLVAITGYGQGPDRQLSHQAGIDVHLTKPVELDALQRTLSRHVKGNAQA